MGRCKNEMEGYCGKGRSRLPDTSKDLPKLLGQYKAKGEEGVGIYSITALSLVSMMYRKLERITAVGGHIDGLIHIH